MQIITVLLGVFKFWDEVTQFIKLLQGTPEENRQKIMESIRVENDKIDKDGRPSWG